MARPFTLALAGDVMLGRLVNRAIAEHGFAYPWGNVLPLLRQADLFGVNLECALTTHDAPWHDGSTKAFYFRADPAAVATLKLAGVDVVSVANNHIGDFGTVGLLETLRVLDAAGIAHAGAGPDLTAARRPAYLAVDDFTVGIVAFADYPAAWAATDAAPGLNYTPVSLAAEDFAAVEASIRAARERANLVVFSIHWGPNMRPRPTQLFRDFARRVVEVGADVFWGHSAHVVQGVEVWRGRFILYDTGDFVDDYAVDPDLRNDLSALFLVRLRPPRIERLELVPVKISRMQVNLLHGSERAWFADRLRMLCAELGTVVVAEGERLVIGL